MVGARSSARRRACSWRTALPAARCLAVSRAPRSPPSLTPRRFAAARASFVRFEIMPASSSAMAAICWSMNLPVAPSIMGSRLCRGGSKSLTYPAVDCESARPETHHRRAMLTHCVHRLTIHRKCETAPAGGSKLNADVGQSSRPIYTAVGDIRRAGLSQDRPIKTAQGIDRPQCRTRAVALARGARADDCSQQWLSASLCRLATGGSCAVRQLYTDDEEVLFQAARPILLNGIEDIVSRADLGDRAIFLTLAPIGEAQRRAESELWREFELTRPHILGALLDAVVHGLRALDRVQLDRLPRMADFALWATACETALCPAAPTL